MNPKMIADFFHAVTTALKGGHDTVISFFMVDLTGPRFSSSCRSQSYIFSFYSIFTIGYADNTPVPVRENVKCKA